MKQTMKSWVTGACVCSRMFLWCCCEIWPSRTMKFSHQWFPWFRPDWLNTSGIHVHIVYGVCVRACVRACVCVCCSLCELFVLICLPHSESIKLQMMLWLENMDDCVFMGPATMLKGLGLRCLTCDMNDCLHGTSHTTKRFKTEAQRLALEKLNNHA